MILKRLKAINDTEYYIENMELNNTIDMLAEEEVARNFPEEVNE